VVHSGPHAWSTGGASARRNEREENTAIRIRKKIVRRRSDDRPKLPRKRAERLKAPESSGQDEEGQAAAAAKNRERDARLRIIEAFRRLGIPPDHWPDFVRAFHADPHQQIEYHQFMTPASFQPPDFDRLLESPQDWVKKANREWEQHRNKFLQECEDWVRTGIDEAIVEVRPRGSGKEWPTRVGSRRRGSNTLMDQRYEWAARYLLKTRLKEIAGADADAATVGRVAREILRLASWSNK
jgi:hypothetical protein